MAGIGNCLILGACVTFFVTSQALLIFALACTPKAWEQKKPNVRICEARLPVEDYRLTRAEYLRIIRESKKRTRRSVCAR